MAEIGYVDEVPLRVVELTGAPGDVYFTDLRLLHSLGANTSSGPRLMATQRLPREWVADRYDADYYQSSPPRNPTGPEQGVPKVLRGGGWDVPQVIPVTWLRDHFIPPDFAGSPVTGFRCAATTLPGIRVVKALLQE